MKLLGTLVRIGFALLVSLEVAFAQAAARQPRSLFPVVVNSKWGYIDRTGKVVIEPTYAEAEEFSEGVAAVKIIKVKRRWGWDWDYGYIDGTGKVVVPLSGNTLGSPMFSEGLARVYSWDGHHQSYRFIDRTGKVVIAPQSGDAGDFSEGLAYASFEGDTWDCWGELTGILPCTQRLARRGFIDMTGRYVVPIQFLTAEDFSEGLAAVKVGRHNWTYIDKTGKRAMKKSFYAAGRFSEGLAPAVSKDFWHAGQVGFIDKSGSFVIPPRYDMARPFAEGLARVRVGGKWGYIDRTGKMVIQPQFDLAQDFSEGLAAVNLGATNQAAWEDPRSWYQQNWPKEMQKIHGSWPGDFSRANPACVWPSNLGGGWELDPSRKFYPGKPLGGKWGYIDRSGKMVIEPQFSAALEFSGGLAQVFAPDPCLQPYTEFGPRHDPPSHDFGYIDLGGKYVWKSTP